MRMWPLARMPARMCWSTSALPTTTWPSAVRMSWQRSATASSFTGASRSRRRAFDRAQRGPAPAQAAPVRGARQRLRPRQLTQARPEDHVEISPAPGAVDHVVAERQEARVQLRAGRGRQDAHPGERRPTARRPARPAQRADAPRDHRRRARQAHGHGPPRRGECQICGHGREGHESHDDGPAHEPAARPPRVLRHRSRSPASPS
jgi:hypothetical protein